MIKQIPKPFSFAAILCLMLMIKGIADAEAMEQNVVKAQGNMLSNYTTILDGFGSVFKQDRYPVLVGASIVPGLQNNLNISLKKEEDDTSVMQIMGPGRLFRRIDNSPYANRVRRSRKPNATIKDKVAVTLEAGIPHNVRVLNSQVHWRVFFPDSRKVLNERGTHAKVYLHAGKNYKVELKIGGIYKKHSTLKTVLSRNKTQLHKVNAEIGMVTSTTNYAKMSISNTLRWNVQGRGKAYHNGTGRKMSTILPSGNYRVTAEIGKVKKSEQITVRRGQHVRMNINLPSSMVKLSAFKGSDMGLDPNMVWTLYYKPHGRMQVMFSRQKNTTRDNVPPRRYTAVLKTRNQEYKKSFIASAGVTEDIKINIKN